MQMRNRDMFPEHSCIVVLLYYKEKGRVVGRERGEHNFLYLLH